MDPSQIYRSLAQVGETQEVEELKHLIINLEKKFEEAEKQKGKLKEELLSRERDLQIWREKSKKFEQEVLNLRTGFAEQEV